MFIVRGVVVGMLVVREMQCQSAECQGYWILNRSECKRCLLVSLQCNCAALTKDE